MTKKRILYFMPDPPTRRDAGNKTHVLQMLEYFNSRSNYIDLEYLSVKDWGGWEEVDKEEFSYQFPYCNLHVLERKMSKKNRIKYFFRYKLPNAIHKNKFLLKKPAIVNHNTNILQQEFNQILQKKKFDYIIISYITWATLIKGNKFLKNARLINDTHDFITAQHKLHDVPNFKMGAAFELEMNLLSLFDETWSQSADEQYLFSQFVAAKHRFIPIMYKSNYELTNERYEKAGYDLIYVGSNNIANVKSVNWFFKEIYPLLSKKIKICIIGKICDYIPSFSNVEKHLFVRDLDEYYLNAKVALCPMLMGTGVKVKTVEALSYGMPVVCNTRGLDGLPLKQGNGCLRGDTPHEFADHVNNLLTNRSFYNKISNDAMKMFDRFFNKKQCYNYLDSVFEIRSTINEDRDEKLDLLIEMKPEKAFTN